MKSRFLIIFLISLFLILPGIISAIDDNVWTTIGGCGENFESNSYVPGEEVWINGQDFIPGTYFWDVLGQPLNSCDSGISLASGDIVVDASGKFCFNTHYIIQNDDCGKYSIGVDGNGNNVNNYYTIEETQTTDSTIIAGIIYNSDYTKPVSGANVIVNCNGIIQTKTSLDDGSYSATYDENMCGSSDEVSVYASHPDYGEGEEAGNIYNDFPAMNINLAVINVPLVPEFGKIIGGLTVLGALSVFFIVRKK
jgi:hypothetical protein